MHADSGAILRGGAAHHLVEQSEKANRNLTGDQNKDLVTHHARASASVSSHSRANSTLWQASFDEHAHEPACGSV
jgi:hypothetical protein